MDYAAEMRRLRLAQGLDPEIPAHIREAVAALISGDGPVATERTNPVQR